MIREHFQYRTTITTILADEEKYITIAKEAMVDARSELEREILRNPFFGSTYEPTPPETSSPGGTADGRGIETRRSRPDGRGCRNNRMVWRGSDAGGGSCLCGNR